MIQATGTITIGVAEYINPLINIYFSSPQKYNPTYVVAQIGEVVDVMVDFEPKQKFIDSEPLEEYFFNITNPSFDVIQPLVIADLSKKYPSVTFTPVA